MFNGSNLNRCPTNAIMQAYLSLGRSIMEYASSQTQPYTELITIIFVNSKNSRVTGHTNCVYRCNTINDIIGEIETSNI